MPGFGKSGTWRMWALRSIGSPGNNGGVLDNSPGPRCKADLAKPPLRGPPCRPGPFCLSIAHSARGKGAAIVMRKSHKIDRIDLKILSALQDQGRMSNLELAAKA